MKSDISCDQENQSRGFWHYIGYLAFGILGIILGAALVYGLLVYAVDLKSEEGQPLAEVESDGANAPLDGAKVPVVEPESDSGFVEVVEQVMPAVVGVNKHVYLSPGIEQSLEEVESGSGVITSEDGYIVTNHHVVEDADWITVVIPGKGSYEAELIGNDALTDLAVLKIEETGLLHVEFGNSNQIRVGETVLAFGNPLGYFQQSVTAGIISAIKRQVRVPGSEYAYTFVQTDALVNPGNSGGPLVNSKGETIGINTAKISLAGVEGIGLSIPSNTVQRVIKDIIENGRVIRPHLGVVIEDWLEYGDQQPERGILIRDIAPDSAAERAGLLPGDIIVSINGEEIYYLAMLFDVLFSYYPGDQVAIQYYRDGAEAEVELTLGEWPESLPVIQDLPESGDAEAEPEEEPDAGEVEPEQPVEPEAAEE
jgi:serine protease Do